VRRGRIWLAQLDPTRGSEIQKTRPVLIVSPDDLNAHLRTVTIVPMTTGSHPAPHRLPIHFDDKDGFLLIEQVRAVDKQRLIRRLGTVNNAMLTRTLEGLQLYFAP